MGLFSPVGSFINDITGASSSASKAHKYTMQQMAANNRYQKEFMQNAHQWEVEDLEKAGLNPVLSAGGSGASASGGGGPAATPVNSAKTPLDLIGGALSAKKTWADANVSQEQANYLKTQQDLTKAQTIKTMLESDILDNQQRKKLEAEYYKLITDAEKNQGGIIANFGGTRITKGIQDFGSLVDQGVTKVANSIKNTAKKIGGGK